MRSVVNEKKDAWKFLIHESKKYWGKLSLMLTIILITTAIVAVFPFLSGKIIDILFYGQEKFLFWKYIFIYGILFGINQILHFVLQVINTDLRVGFVYNIKRAAYRKVLSYRAESLDNLDTGDAVRRITADADEVMNFFYFDIFYGLSAILDLFVCSIMLMKIHIFIALITVLLSVVSFTISKIFSNKIKTIAKRIVDKQAKSTSWLFECLNNMKEIRNLGISKECGNRYLKFEVEYIREKNQKEKQELIVDRIIQGVNTLCMITIYGISALLISNSLFTLGGMVVCIEYFNRITVLLERISKRIITLPERLVFITRLVEIWKVPSENLKLEKNAQEICYGKIVFHDVSFAYEGKTNILNNISFVINPGEICALVGKSGEGKSTIAKLLCGLYSPQSGMITIDGINIQEYNLIQLRKQIGIVQQESIMFNASIRYNVSFSNNKNNDQKIIDVLKKVNLYEYVKNLEKGLDTIVEKEGTNLSGGQKQRLALARAFFKESKILILDESTSALDIETENAVIEKWDEMFRGKTVIIISHQTSTIKNADKIISLQKGEIIYENKNTL